MVNRLVFKKKSQTFKWSAVLLLSIASSAFSAQLWRAPVNKVCIAIPSCSPAEVSNIAKVFARNLKQRCNAEVVYEGDAPLEHQKVKFKY